MFQKLALSVLISVVIALGNEKQLFFTKLLNNERNIWKVNMDGSDSSLVLDLNEEITLMDISSDGKTFIIFKHESEQTYLYSLLDSSEILVPTEGFAISKYSFNDENVVSISGDSTQLVVFNTETMESKILTNSLQDECWFRFSPDKKKVVYYKTTETDSDLVAIMNLENWKEKIIAEDARAGHDFSTSIAWSHNNKIFYRSYSTFDSVSTPDIVMISEEGEVLKRFSDCYSGIFLQPANQINIEITEFISFLKVKYDNKNDQYEFSLYKYDIINDDTVKIVDIGYEYYTMFEWSDYNEFIFYNTSLSYYPSFIRSVRVSDGKIFNLGIGYFPILYDPQQTKITENKKNLISFYLKQNYPNPFNPNTKITFNLPQRSKVKLSVFNVMGEQISVLIDEYKNVGTHSVQWDASGQASGVYFYTLETEKFVQTKKMVLLQ